jgi:Txe/YoeB family toxin of Txe-Axe toxin-antitoxin module
MSKSNTKEARIKILTDTQLARKQETLEKVNKAIERLQKIGAKINFQTIAKEANVSVPYLYKYPELKAHIAQLRNQQSSMPSSSTLQPPVTTKAHSQIVERLKKRIHELEKDNLELKRKNEALAGQVYRVYSLQEQIERQKEIIQTLENRFKSANQQKTDAQVIPLDQKSQIISDLILSELSQLGIQLNDNLKKLIIAVAESDVLAAIEYYKYEQERTNIDNPGGWLARAIKGCWKKPDNLQQISKSEKLLQNQSIFSSPSQVDREFASLEELAHISTIFQGKSDD